MLASVVISQNLGSVKSLKDLRLIIAHVKKTSYEQIALYADKVDLDDSDLTSFEELLARYKSGAPISKILNIRGFWKHDFFVNEFVLDPRPETELIIEEVLKRFNTEDEFKFLDVGTGSGCILLSLLSEFKNSYGIGIDISPEAIQVALRNQEKLHITNAEFLNIGWNDFRGSVDIIVSNPPYIRTQDIAALDISVREYDPIIALDGGLSGLRSYEEISSLAKQWISPGGCIFFEVGYDQAKDVADILTQRGYTSIEISKDLAGINRLVSGISQG